MVKRPQVWCHLADQLPGLQHCHASVQEQVEGVQAVKEVVRQGQQAAAGQVVCQAGLRLHAPLVWVFDQENLGGGGGRGCKLICLGVRGNACTSTPSWQSHIRHHSLSLTTPCPVSHITHHTLSLFHTHAHYHTSHFTLSCFHARTRGTHNDARPSQPPPGHSPCP